MMKINQNNYESYFIDYLEGKLDENIVDDFIEFLQQNPDLKKELSLFENIPIIPENITFRKKGKLYKNIFDIDSEFNRASIEHIENDISKKDKTQFEEYLAKHPEKEKESALFNYTKLKPDESIIFNKKQNIYHYSKPRNIFLWTVRIAAVLVLAFIIYILTEHSANNILQENQVASVENKEIQKNNSPDSKRETNKMSVKQDEKERPQVIEQKKDTTSVIKKPVLKTKESKSLRENAKGRLDDNDLTIHQYQNPAELNPITASLYTTQNALLAKMTLIKKIEKPVFEEILLADVIKEKTGINKLNLNKIKKAGLNLISNFTKDNLSYETNKEDQITEIKFDSRLMAFSFPTRNEKEGK